MRFSHGVSAQAFGTAFCVMKRKMILEVLRDYLENAEDMLPSETLDAFVPEDQQEAVVLSMLDETYRWLDELEVERRRIDHHLRTRGSLRTPD